ncbi:MAG: alkaline phosphatase family protein [Thermodesulfobacteriota bacterium]
MPAHRPRLALLGLDGLPFSLARAWAASGLAPNLARLALAPTARPLRAELPELSPVNWASLATAAGPEAHGVFGFTRLDPITFAVSVMDSTWIETPTIFDRLSERGLTSKVLNLPGMAPARPLRGMLAAGFPATNLAAAAYPPPLARLLAARGYRIEPDTALGLSDPDRLLSGLAASLAGRRAALDLLWPDLAWDLFVCVLTETDRLFHFLFAALEEPGHPLHAACQAFVRRWDAAVGDFLDRFAALPGPKRLLVLADHGFTRLKTEADLNAWLRGRGLLRLAGSPRSELDAAAAAPGSSALALDPGRIFLLTPDRFPRGGLAPSRAADLAESLRRQLLDLRWEGQPVIKAVHRGPDLYPGSASPHRPDLVCEPHPGFSLTAKLDRAEVFSLHGRTGVHTADDAFFYDSAGAKPERVRDAGKLVLDFFGA